MRGTLKLIPVDKPIDGMQVVVDYWEHHSIRTVVRVDKKYIWVTESTPEFEQPILHEHVKQIVVEYNPNPHAGLSKKGTGPGATFKETEILPLHPSDWKWAIEHIGEEVEFEKEDSFTESSDGKYITGNIIYAKLIISSPMIYTEEEVEQLVIDAMVYSANAKKPFDRKEWWDKHKKK